MSVAYPSGFPSGQLLDGATIGRVSQVVRTQMDVGPAKVRRRLTAQPRPARLRHVATTTQVATFDAWFDGPLGGGALAFAWTHPNSGATVDFRFVDPPEWRAIGGGYWESVWSLEILP